MSLSPVACHCHLPHRESQNIEIALVEGGWRMRYFSAEFDSAFGGANGRSIPEVRDQPPRSVSDWAQILCVTISPGAWILAALPRKIRFLTIFGDPDFDFMLLRTASPVDEGVQCATLLRPNNENLAS